MTQYQRGFVDRRSALQAVRLPAQMCAGPLPYNTQMEVARGQSWIIKTGSSGIPGRTSYDPGRALCDSYIVDENPNPPALLEETNQDNDTLNQYVYNLSTDPVAPNEWFIAVQVGNVLVVSAGGGGGGTSNRRIQFRSTTKMTNGSITGTVILSEGPTGYAIGDLVDFKDPFNLFMDAEPDAIGWAYFRPANEHCDLEEGRWEVEELSLPVRKISGRTLACLKKGDTEATIELTLDSGSGMLSGYHNVDRPPEIGESVVTIQAQNPYGLDTCPNKIVTIERRPILVPSDPDNCNLPLGTTSSNVQWVIVQVEEQIARWIRVAASVEGSVVTWSFDGVYWDGCNPFAGSCEQPDIGTICNAVCTEDGACGIACYNPEAHAYVVVSTSSALMGEPETETIVTEVADAGALYPCELEVHTQEVCVVKTGEPSMLRVGFSTQDITVVTDATTQGSSIYLNRQTITTCSVTPAEPDVVDICPLLCYCDQFYACCEAQCGCETYDCVWDWDDNTSTWINTIPCPEGCDCSDEPPAGTPAPGEPTTYTYPCEDAGQVCCDNVSSSTAVSFVDFQFFDPNNFDTTQGLLAAGSSSFSAAGPCGATLTFGVTWTNMSCGVNQTTQATAVLKKNGTCCYWDVSLTQPTAACLDGSNLGDGWPGSQVKVPTCDGEDPNDCSQWVGDCAAVCDDGGFDQVSFTVTNIGDCN